MRAEFRCMSCRRLLPLSLLGGTRKGNRPCCVECTEQRNKAMQAIRDRQRPQPG